MTEHRGSRVGHDGLRLRADRTHPLLPGHMEIDGCRTLHLGRDPGDHSMRHHGERAWNQVYAVTLEPCDTTTQLRWTIPAEAEEPEQAEA
ncbi:hypothetical protein AB0D10_31035 [Kitasatospora sp. NPDC048545]|uniref:hypothetical protein n=1 Tax=Kitasatospora sp. NPDC048545 TaxID=3157208 RepID=UPI00340332B9